MHCCYETWPLVQDVDWWFGKWFLDDSLLLICLFYLFLYDFFICSFSMYLFVFTLSRLLITAVPNGQILPPREKKWISTTFCFQNEVVCLFMGSFLVFLFFHLIVSLFVFAFLEFEARFFKLEMILSSTFEVAWSFELLMLLVFRSFCETCSTLVCFLYQKIVVMRGTCHSANLR